MVLLGVAKKYQLDQQCALKFPNVHGHVRIRHETSKTCGYSKELNCGRISRSLWLIKLKSSTGTMLREGTENVEVR